MKAFDFAGKELWVRELQKDFGAFGIQFGYASSPLLHENALYYDPMVNVAEIVAYHRQLLEHPEKYTIGTRNVLQWCARFIEDAANGSTSSKMVRYVEGLTAMQRLRRTIDGAFTDFDVLVVPTLKAFPPTIDTAVRAEGSPDIEDRPLFSIENTLTFNRLGLPALTVPCGFSTEGLPIGLMIAGPRYSEGKLLALGAAYERATEWHKRRPPRAA
jgi:aspartyl-tRNA(Asn)/glutamyl-tRNA(Gln) amidotransferase subunit A